MNITWSQTEKNVLLAGAYRVIQQQPHLSDVKAFREAMFTLLPPGRQRISLNKNHLQQMFPTFKREDVKELNVHDVAFQQSTANTNAVQLLTKALESILVQTMKNALTNPEITTLLQQLLDKSK